MCAFHRGAQIAQSGLIYHIDAPNTKSYSDYNILERTEEFDNAYWTKANTTITANNTTAPDGTLTADKLVEDTSNLAHDIIILRKGSNETLTLSVYAKAAGRNLIIVQLYNNIGSSVQSVFNLTTGIIQNPINVTGSDYISISSNIESVGNSWYRCSITATKLAINTTNNIAIYLWDGTNSNASYIGDGVSGVYIWGAQLTQLSQTQQGVQASPIRPYQKVVTRKTTVNSLVKPDNIGTLTNGVAYDGKSFSFDGVNDYISIPDNPVLNITTSLTLSAWIRIPNITGTKVILGRWNTISGTAKNVYKLQINGANAVIDVSGTGANDITLANSTPLVANVWYHIVGVYASGTTPTLNIYINGVLNNGTLTGTVPTSLFSTSVENHIGVDGSSYFTGNISNAQIYNRPLSALEIQQNFNATKSRYL